MAVGESGLQIYLQPALHQGRLSHLAPAQSGTPHGAERSTGSRRGATAALVSHTRASPFGRGRQWGQWRIMVDLGEGLKPTHPGPVHGIWDHLHPGILIYSLKSLRTGGRGDNDNLGF